MQLKKENRDLVLYDIVRVGYVIYEPKASEIYR